MKLEDTNSAQITSVTLHVYEGELEYDADGKIVNKLRETLTYNREQTNGHCDQRQESDS